MYPRPDQRPSVLSIEEGYFKSGLYLGLFVPALKVQSFGRVRWSLLPIVRNFGPSSTSEDTWLSIYKWTFHVWKVFSAASWFASFSEVFASSCRRFSNYNFFLPLWYLSHPRWSINPKKENDTCNDRIHDGIQMYLMTFFFFVLVLVKIHSFDKCSHYMQKIKSGTGRKLSRPTKAS